MTLDWTPLDRELALWSEEDRVVPLWWRDDDAVAPSPALNRLSSLSARLGLPVYLAVIPARAEPALADLVASAPHLIPVQHGWVHENHAEAGQKKAELGAHRPAAQVLDEVRRGRARMLDLFGDRMRPMLVPPWNRIAPEVVAGLPGVGLSWLSTYTPRRGRMAAPGLEQVNTHLDPVDWKGTRGLLPPERLIEGLVATLADRRNGAIDATEPLGLLTHHLVHDDAIWDFTEAVLERLLAGPVRVWTVPKTEDEE
ncbi:polysaccharide deacetylase family protein [Cribrihabitans sp. XS_ASV171]